MLDRVLGWMFIGGIALGIYQAFTPTKRILVSFDYDHDRHYRYLLSALNENSRSELVFEDVTPEEIRSSDIGRIKAVLTGKIRGSTHVLVIVGKYANSYHPDREKIDARNWQWWEINQAKAERKKLVAVKIDRSNPAPDPLLNAGASWAYGFDVPAIIKAVEGA